MYKIILMEKLWYGLACLEISSWLFNGYYINYFVKFKNRFTSLGLPKGRLFTMELQ